MSRNTAARRVGNPERIRNVARRVIETQRAGHRVVVVVSAMSGVTDGLIKLAHEVSPAPPNASWTCSSPPANRPPSRCWRWPSTPRARAPLSLTGAQAGIVTDGVHTKAKIANITPKQILHRAR